MSVGWRTASLLSIVALSCGPRDNGEPAEPPSPAVGMSPVSLAEPETTWNADYMAGFYAREANQTETWRWTSKSAAIRFRNPKAHALLLLTVSGRPRRFHTPQSVSVRVGDHVVDTFVLSSPAVVTHTVELGSELMAGLESFAVEIDIDKTFVPASMPGTSSRDTRELGIRVLSAILQPSVVVRPPRGLLPTPETDEDGRSYRWSYRRVLFFGGPDARVFEVQLRRADGVPQTVTVAINGQPVDELLLEADSWRHREYNVPPSRDGTVRAELLIAPGWRVDDLSPPRGLMIGDYVWRE